MMLKYVDGIAINNKGKISSFMQTGEINKAYSFYIIDKPHKKLVEGWPINSLSVIEETGEYYFDNPNYKDQRFDSVKKKYKAELINFYVKELKLRKK